MGTLPDLSILKGPTRQLTPNHISRLFEITAAAKRPTNDNEQTALILEENNQIRTLSYAKLDKLTNKIARTILQTIKTHKLGRNSDGDRVIAVNLNPTDKLVVILLAIWKSGAAYLPLDHSFPGPRIQHIIAESRPMMVIDDDDDNDDNANGRDHYKDIVVLPLDELIEQSADQPEESLYEEERVRHVKDDLAIVLYTSGSTGVPKGVRLTHKTILNRLQWQFKTFPYNASEKVCVFKTALTFVDSISEIWGPLINGLAILIVSKSLTKDPEQLIGLLDKYKVERLVLVPSLLRSLLMYLELKNNKSFLKHLKLWVCSGETLALSLAEEFFKFFPNSDHKLCNFYGSTEIMGDVTYHVMSNQHDLKQLTHVPIGLPIDNTIIYLFDHELRPVKSGEIGEIFVAGLNVASGYVNGRDPDKFLNNQLALDPNYARLYRTGDFGRIVDGCVCYEGRTDSQIKIRGHRVDLTEIETALNSIDQIDKSIVLCYKAGEMNQTLLGFVTTNTLISENQIETALRGKLPGYMVPQVILIESVPLLVNGKIDRQALLKSYENTNNNDDDCVELDIDYTGVPPNQMDAAKVLFEIVGNVLSRAARSAISIDANFYEIGGNSLNSIYTITQLSEKGYNISVTDFIAAIDLGEVLERMTNDSVLSTLAPPQFTAEFLRDDHKLAVIDMITTSFHQKADLERWLAPHIYVEDYTELMNALWEPLIEKNLSFVIKTDSGKIIGVGLNFDARDEPEVEIKSKLTVVFEFLESLEAPIMNSKLPPGTGQVLHSFMMATHSSLHAKDNVAVMQFMESEVIRTARSRGFVGVFTTNTSPLTQQLGQDVYKYQTLLNYQVNQYVAGDGTKPFGLAPDTQRAIVNYKPLVI